MSEVLESAFDRIASGLEDYTPALTVWLAFPILVLAMLWALSLARFLLGLVTRLVVIPAGQVLVAIGHTLLLTLEFLGTQLWRLFRRPPPNLVYSVSDALAAAKAPMMTWLRVTSDRVDRLARRPWKRTRLLAVVLILGWWNANYCHPSSNMDCKAPPSAWAQSVNGAVRDLFREDGASERANAGTFASAAMASLIISALSQPREPVGHSFARLRR